jgi:outer membrane cobalamin receptor
MLETRIQWDSYRSTYEGQASPFQNESLNDRVHKLCSWNTGLKVSPLRWLSLRSNYGVYARVPSFYELFGDRGHTLSNKDLKPEYGRRYDAGLRAQFGYETYHGFAFEIDVFHTDFADLIQWYVNDAGFVIPDNVSESYVEGIETVFDVLFFGIIRASGNLTVQDSRVVQEKRKYYRDKKLPDRPRVYGASKIEISNGWVKVFWEAEGKSDYYLDRVNQRPYPDRFLQNLGTTLAFSKKRLKITFISDNIMDIHTFDRAGMPLPGRSYSLTISFNIDRNYQEGGGTDP